MSTIGFDGRASNYSVGGRMVANRVVGEEGIFTSVTTTYLQQVVPGKGALYQVTGYAPVELATAAAADILFLNNQPGLAANTDAADASALVIPAGARIASVEITNNGTAVVGGTTFNLDTAVYPAPVAVTSLAAGVAEATVNLAIGTRLSNITSTALGTAGSLTDAVAAVADDTGLVLTVGATPVTAGDLAVLITYIL